jgi:hypothetical protein
MGLFSRNKESLTTLGSSLNKETKKPVEGRPEKNLEIKSMSSQELGEKVRHSIGEKLKGVGAFLKRGLDRMIGGGIKGGVYAKEGIQSGAQKLGTWAEQGLDKYVELHQRGTEAMGKLSERAGDVVYGAGAAVGKGAKAAGREAKFGAEVVAGAGVAAYEGVKTGVKKTGEFIEGKYDAFADGMDRGVNYLAGKALDIKASAENRIDAWKGRFEAWQQAKAENRRLQTVAVLKAELTGLAQRQEMVAKALEQLEGNGRLAQELQAA